MMVENKRLKNKLLDIYKKDKISSDEIYAMLLSEKKEQQIYSVYKKRLNNLCLYLYYYYNNDLQSLIKQELPFPIQKGLNFKQFSEMVEKYELYNFDNVVIENDNYYNLISRAFRNKDKLIETFEWVEFQKDRLENRELNEQNFSNKIYLSVPNDELEHFALMLLANCVAKDVNYDFKINNNPYISRSDNVVIYATNENFQQYIDIIHSILASGIKTNREQQHLLALAYDKDISVAPYLDQNGESYSSIICNEIYRLKNESSSFENFHLQVKNVIDDCLKNMYINNDPSQGLRHS